METKRLRRFGTVAACSLLLVVALWETWHQRPVEVAKAKPTPLADQITLATGLAVEAVGAETISCLNFLDNHDLSPWRERLEKRFKELEAREP